MKNLIKKLFKKEVILYIIFGIITTFVNLATFYILTNFCGLNENLANFIAITLAVLTAYITNKDMVFHSKAQGFKERIIEFFKFILGRLFTMVVEFFGGMILFMTPIPEMISKVVITMVVIVLNFFISKFFAFKK